MGEKLSTERKLPVRIEVSAGGVIFSRRAGKFRVALVAVKRSRRRSPKADALTVRAWCLPKGLVKKGENSRSAAEREVKEETGIEGSVIERLGSIDYWFVGTDREKKARTCPLEPRRRRIHKVVHFYLLERLGGSVKRHDWEVDEARWFPIDEAIAKATYESERGVLLKAKDRLLHDVSEEDKGKISPAAEGDSDAIGARPSGRDSSTRARGPRGGGTSR